MGLYPPGKSGADTLSKGEAENIKQAWATPFKVRDAAKINDQLGFAALPNELAAVPILLFLNSDLNDDASTDGCAYINTVGDARAADPTIWTAYDEWRELINEPLRQEVGVTAAEEEAADFVTFERFTDTAVAEDFEGIFKHGDYNTDKQWAITNQFQRAWLSDDYSKDARDLMMSRLLRKPLKVMEKRVAATLGMRQGLFGEANSDRNELKFLIYSAHDTQVDSMMVFLTQSKESFDYIPYASQVTFELKHSPKCVADGAGLECFGVSVLFNGEPMKFDQCSGDGFSTDGTGCTWREFKHFMDSIWYSGKFKHDLNKACGQEYVHPTTSEQIPSPLH